MGRKDHGRRYRGIARHICTHLASQFCLWKHINVHTIFNLINIELVGLISLQS